VEETKEQLLLQVPKEVPKVASASGKASAASKKRNLGDVVDNEASRESKKRKL
jgi:hypothetical protein